MSEQPAPNASRTDPRWGAVAYVPVLLAGEPLQLWLARRKGGAR